MQVLAPVVEEPGLAQVFGSAELLFEVALEADEYVVVRRAIAAGLVVDLPADDVQGCPCSG
jgi:hypothetical protein